MKVVLVTQYYPPEKSAASNRALHFAESLSRHHQVTVLCQSPHYPEGKTYPGFSHFISHKTLKPGYSVIRFYTFKTRNSGTLKRFLNYLSFLIIGFIVGLQNVKKADIIIATTPQILVGLLGLFLSKRKRARFILDVRDLWPDSLTSLGVIQKGSLVEQILLKIENKLYSQAEKILVVSPGMAEYIQKIKNIEINKIRVVPNCIDLSKYNLSSPRKSELGLPQDTIIAIFAGNHSRAQNMRDLLTSVEYSSQEGKKITFVFIGEGEEKEWMMQRSRNLRLQNILFIPNQPFEKLKAYLQCADVCLASLNGDPLFDSAIPTKILEYLAMGKFLVFLGRNSFVNELESIGLAKSVSPEKPELLAAAIVKVLNAEEDAAERRDRARSFVEKHFSLNKFNIQTEATLNRSTL